MQYPPIFLVAWFVSAAFTVLVGAGVLTYIRRTWQLIRADEDGSAQERLLDAIDQLQAQMYAMTDRLERMERRLEPSVDEDPTGVPGTEG